MKKALISLLVIIILAGAGAYYFYKKSHKFVAFHHPNKVLQELKEGNVRFVSGKPQHSNYAKKMVSAKLADHPKAVILNCSTSRNIPEISFDQNIGEIQTIRVSGNVVGTDVLGSMEYATQNEGATLIVVLGHTNCSVMKAACRARKLGNFTQILQKIEPAVKTTEANLKNSNCASPVLIDAITRQNVKNMVQLIPQQSPIIADLVKKGHVKVVGGIYDSATGAVVFIK